MGSSILLRLYVCVICTCLFSVPAVASEEGLPFPVPMTQEELPTRALVKTTQGDIEIEFLREVAPVTVRNFQHLVGKKFYENLLFHSYQPGYVIQGGDPLGTGKGGPGYTLPPEFSDVKLVRGSVAMARRPTPVNPERRSNGSQFFICLTRARHLDGHYTVFGKIVSGMESADKLRKGDRILSVSLSRK